ncbi:hypothetical protein SAMN04488072_12021 [Lentibacillus halodurans]|uniref:Uncharacterized protein n=1 Tax=Lentibacillus halodurans TaxID=237679 RepID=A0A1I1AGA8_9BACI|nr:hypothetical protein [Lentibacillus halodurans]SFB37055.1 hypothetical protein SAMN04488072_12021 [Lentibacillus halodurans]
MKNLVNIMLISFYVSMLIGCSTPSEEEAIKSVEESARESFQADDSIETNQQLDAFSIYLPAGMEIVEEDASNVILEDGDQTYIVFYNNLEDPLSELSYESAAAKSDKALLLETFKDKEKFGYIRILPDEEKDHYELQAGVGGVKITTYTSKSEMESDTEVMMKMARSIVMGQNNKE